jgi:hypothetical protein
MYFCPVNKPGVLMLSASETSELMLDSIRVYSLYMYVINHNENCTLLWTWLTFPQCQRIETDTSCWPAVDWTTSALLGQGLMNSTESSIFYDVTPQALFIPCFMLVFPWLILRPWRWRRHNSSKYLLFFNGLDGVIPRKETFFRTTTMRASNHT